MILSIIIIHNMNMLLIIMIQNKNKVILIMISLKVQRGGPQGPERGV